MPDVVELFFELIEKKGKMYAASKLGHDGTSIVDRWIRQKDIPSSRRWAVYSLLKSEGLL